MKTLLRCLFLFIFGLLFTQTASATYDPHVGRFLSRDPLGEAGGFNQYAYCGNDPINRHDPLGLDWRVSEGNLYWGENSTAYDGSSLRSQKTYWDLGPLHKGYSLSNDQLTGVQGVFRNLMSGAGSIGIVENEDILKSIMLLEGFYPEKVNQLHGGANPMDVIMGVNSARILAGASGDGPTIGQSDVEPLVAFSQRVQSNSVNQFFREHPIFSRVMSDASVTLPYAAIGIGQMARGSTALPSIGHRMDRGKLYTYQSGQNSPFAGEVFRTGSAQGRLWATHHAPGPWAFEGGLNNSLTRAWRTGRWNPFESAQEISGAAAEQFTRVRAFGPFRAWKRTGGQYYTTTPGDLNLNTGKFMPATGRQSFLRYWDSAASHGIDILSWGGATSPLWAPFVFEDE